MIEKIQIYKQKIMEFCSEKELFELYKLVWSEKKKSQQKNNKIWSFPMEDLPSSFIFQIKWF